MLSQYIVLILTPICRIRNNDRNFQLFVSNMIKFALKRNCAAWKMNKMRSNAITKLNLFLLFFIWSHLWIIFLHKFLEARRLRITGFMILNWYFFTDRADGGRGNVLGGYTCPQFFLFLEYWEKIYKKSKLLMKKFHFPIFCS